MRQRRLAKIFRTACERVPDGTQARSGNAGVFAPRDKETDLQLHDSLLDTHRSTCQSQTPRDFEPSRPPLRPLRA